MRPVDFLAMAPLLMVTATIVLVLLQLSIRRSPTGTTMLTLAGLLAALGAIAVAAPHIPVAVTPLLTIDGLSLFFTGVLLAATAAVALLGADYWPNRIRHRGAYALLLLMAALGACVLSAAAHFAALFLGLEILSVALYGLIGYMPHRRESLEAGLKYVILAAAASTFILFGMALIYRQTGSLAFSALRNGGGYAGPQGGASLMMAGGTAMLLVGLGFKLALVPFHMWTPDVYQGAPAPTTAFVATVSKISVVVLLIRLFLPLAPTDHLLLYRTLGLLAFASMVGGNLLALRQRRVKRLLAYSSIAHLGYLLTAFLAGGQAALTATVFYLLAYALTIMGAFGVVTVLSGEHADADDLSTFQGLFYRNPLLGTILVLMLLSLAGIPLTAGFVGKFMAVAAGAARDLWWLVITLALTSGIGLFYYLRVIIAIFGESSQEGPSFGPLPRSHASATVMLTVTACLVVWLGVAPGPILDWIAAAVTLGR